MFKRCNAPIPPAIGFRCRRGAGGAGGGTGRPRSAGFTLVELLVVVVIVGVLAGLSMVGVHAALAKARSMREMGAAKNLIAAYLLAAQDNDGYLMVAHYEGRADDLNNAETVLPDGSTIGSAELHRYPYRLAPYFNYQIDGTLLVNDNKEQIKEAFPGGQYTYGTSLCPALGINYYFMGGYKVDNEIAGQAECVTSMGRAKNANLIVFASAFLDVDGDRISGRYGVEPPKYRTDLWSGTETGHVDARHNGKAICAFLNGAVKALTIEEMKDMRLWSYRAALVDDPDYKVASSGSAGLPGTGGGGGRR